MEQLVDIQIADAPNGNGLPNTFIPVKQFHQIISEKKTNPYKAKISFTPYLNSVSKRSGLNCDISKGIFAKMKEGLAMLPVTEELIQQQNGLDSIAPLLFPSLFLAGQMGFVGVPFSREFLYVSPTFKELYQSDSWEMNIANFAGHAKARHGALDAGFIILDRLYNEKVDLIFSETMHMRNKENGLERHLKFNILLDFVDVKPIKPLKKLSPKQIDDLLNNWEDESLWKEYFPPENFLFEGFVMGQVIDVTDREILSIVETMMAKEEGKIDYENGLNYLQNLIRSFLQKPEIDFGSTYAQGAQWQESTTWGLLREFNKEIAYPSFNNPNTIYGKVLSTGKAITIGELKNEKNLGPLEKEIIKRGYRSLLLAPIYHDNGFIGGILEIAAPLPYRFNQMTVLKLKDFIELYAVGMMKFIREIDNMVRLTVQQQFTSIHPSVEWKFNQAATQFYWSKTSNYPQTEISPIVFKDIYPIYGQADIVGSSKLRNKFIAADLIDNLEKINKLIKICDKKTGFHLLDLYLNKTSAYLSRLRKGEFVSSDETEIVGLLTREVHPLLNEIKNQYKKEIPSKYFNEYFNSLDADLNIIYNKRKDYEDSVTMLCNSISDYLEKEDEKMQGILPHYFEKYKTDGIEYNIYVGQAILEKGKFNPYLLKDFRLWQLLHLCEITRMVAENAKNMPVPLTTAQLVFVYNSTLSIRFRMDEKQFDVDGAYNVRYEILKKRIDKAVVKGTGERLTQSGKIAIVWLQEKDKNEYLEYLDYLLSKNYISDEIEDLELEKLQGAEGLRALRVTVI